MWLGVWEVGRTLVPLLVRPAAVWLRGWEVGLTLVVFASGWEVGLALVALPVGMGAAARLGWGADFSVAGCVEEAVVRSLCTST